MRVLGGHNFYFFFLWQLRSFISANNRYKEKINTNFCIYTDNKKEVHTTHIEFINKLCSSHPLSASPFDSFYILPLLLLEALPLNLVGTMAIIACESKKQAVIASFTAKAEQQAIEHRIAKGVWLIFIDPTPFFFFFFL